MRINNINNITLEQAVKIYNTMGMSFIIRDGKLKGFIKEPKKQIKN